jgi:hypothetical protein
MKAEIKNEVSAARARLASYASLSGTASPVVWQIKTWLARRIDEHRGLQTALKHFGFKNPQLAEQSSRLASLIAEGQRTLSELRVGELMAKTKNL